MSLFRALSLPFREAVYVLRTALRSRVAPTWPQALVGVLTKGPVFIAAVTTWSTLFLPNHPFPYILMLTLSTCVEIFHGVFASTWLNILKKFEEERGLTYLLAFNLLYTQSIAASFRSISWTALPNIIPPWSLSYWRDMSVMTIVGGMVGTLAYSGINALYAKGYLSDNWRTYVQHLRDFLMFGNGVFFDTGLMLVFWSIFVLKQLLDIGIYLVGKQVAPKRGSEAERNGVVVMGVREAFVTSTAVFATLGRAVFKRFGGSKRKDLESTAAGLRDVEAQNSGSGGRVSYGSCKADVEQ